MAGHNNPETYKISIADRRRYLTALKKVLDEFSPVVEVEYGEWEGCPKWGTDEYGETALIRLFQLLGGRMDIDVTYHVNDFFSKGWEDTHSRGLQDGKDGCEQSN